MKPIVYNLEPYGYSENAVSLWLNNGYNYVSGSFKDLGSFDNICSVEILIVRLKNYIDKSIIDLLPNLKFVITATTGLDHIDERLLLERKIELVSLRVYKEFLDTIPSTAEHTWALLLALVRNVPSANSDVRNGSWNRDLFRGYQLKNKSIGIIGLGRTGKKVANYANAFGMKVYFYDPFVLSDEQIGLNNILELASLSDFISIHVHLLPSTTNLINKTFISHCKEGVYIINTSRGKVCDELALFNGLQNNKIKGIATDVLDTELGIISNSYLWQAQKMGANVIITPHIGGATWDAMWDCEEFLARKFTSNHLISS
jgi:D-3-phosphoglycerate dehydrogenase